MGTDKDRSSRPSKRGKIIQEKNEARKKWLQLKTRISWNAHINKRNQAIKFAHKSKKNGSAINNPNRRKPREEQN